VLPNLVPDIANAVRSSRAFRVYVCNVATQQGETDHYDCLDHWVALREHGGEGLVDTVVANDCTDLPLAGPSVPVRPSSNGVLGIATYSADLVDHQRPWRHDSDQLAESLIALLEEQTGPLEFDQPELPD